MAKKGKMLVLTNAVSGKDAEFNKWYNTIHAQEVCGLDGFTGMTRYRVSQQVGPPANPPEHGYVAIYDLSDVDTATAAIAAGRSKFTASDAADMKSILSAKMEEIFTYKK